MTDSFILPLLEHNSGSHILRYLPQIVEAQRQASAVLTLTRFRTIGRSKAAVNRGDFQLAALALLTYGIGIDREGPVHSGTTIASITIQIGTLVGAVDDLVDDPARPIENRRTFLMSVYEDLTQGLVHESPFHQEQQCFLLAQHLYKLVFAERSCVALQPLLERCMSAVNSQRGQNDLDQLIVTETIVGGSICEIIPAIAEVVTGRSFPLAREIAQLFGAAGQMMDNLFDLDRDMHGLVNTYGTRRLLREGDSQVVRQSIAMAYLATAEELLRDGDNKLYSPAQKRIYDLLKHLLFVRYPMSTRYPHGQHCWMV